MLLLRWLNRRLNFIIIRRLWISMLRVSLGQEGETEVFESASIFNLWVCLSELRHLYTFSLWIVSWGLLIFVSDQRSSFRFHFLKAQSSKRFISVCFAYLFGLESLALSSLLGTCIHDFVEKFLLMGILSVGFKVRIFEFRLFKCLEASLAKYSPSEIQILWNLKLYKILREALDLLWQHTLSHRCVLAFIRELPPFLNFEGAPLPIEFRPIEEIGSMIQVKSMVLKSLETCLGLNGRLKVFPEFSIQSYILPACRWNRAAWRKSLEFTLWAKVILGCLPVFAWWVLFKLIDVLALLALHCFQLYLIE